MDELCIRFSHLSEKIFDSLENDSIIKCKEASRFWFNHLDGQKLVQIRIIKEKVKQVHSIGEAWNNVFNSASTETIMTLGVAVNQWLLVKVILILRFPNRGIKITGEVASQGGAWSQ